MNHHIKWPVLYLLPAVFILIGTVQARNENDFRIVTVKEGDSISYLSFKLYNKYNDRILKAIMMANPEIKNPNLIFISQKIKFPKLSQIEAISFSDSETNVKPITETQPSGNERLENEHNQYDRSDTENRNSRSGEDSVSQERKKEMTAFITFLTGDVEILPIGRNEWQPARINQALYTGDQVRAKSRSRAEVIVENKSVIRLSENSNLTITKLEKEPEKKIEKVSFYLSLGRMWNKAKKLMNNESEYHVNTPTALSGIRGTTYSVDILENNDTCFKTWSGEINVWNPLAKQQASRMKTPGEKTLSPPVEVSGPRIVEGPHEVSMTEWKNIVVKQYETLTVRKNGEADKQQFNPGIEKNDQWVEWNTQRDEDLEKTIPFL